MKIRVEINNQILVAELENNSSAVALYENLKDGDLTVEMEDYEGFEKVGSLGFSLPTNDRSYTTKPGDIILYLGNNLVFYYGTNRWSFTKIGEFQNVTKSDLVKIFGSGDIVAHISLLCLE